MEAEQRREEHRDEQVVGRPDPEQRRRHAFRRRGRGMHLGHLVRKLGEGVRRAANHGLLDQTLGREHHPHVEEGEEDRHRQQEVLILENQGKNRTQSEAPHHEPALVDRQDKQTKVRILDVP